MLEMDFCPCFQYSLCWTCWRDGEKLFECTTHMKMPEQWWELLFWLNILLFFILGLQGYSASLNWFDGLAGKNAMTFFFCWIIYRWKISALLDLTQKALKCFLQPDLTLFSTFCLASKKTWFSQIWIFFFFPFFSFWFREWNNYLHRPIPDSNHMSGLHSNEPCSPTSGNSPWPQWHPAVLLMGVGAVELFACHWHFPASNTLLHMPPLSSSSSCS